MPDARPTSSTEHRGVLLVLSGPSGVGKTTITRVLREKLPDAVFSVSATTRPRTSGEVHGVDYYFLGEGEFQRRVDGGEFLEHAVYAGHRYGTLRDPVDEQLAQGRLVMLDIDVQGARQVRAARPDMLGVFILPPGEEELLQRLRQRRREDEASIQKRFAQAKREIEDAKQEGLYDALIVNDDLDRAIDELMRLIDRRRTASAP